MSFEILVDTREQKPYTFSEHNNVSKEGLNVGDYTIRGFERDFAVERKTLDDLANSIGNERNRFEREMERADDQGFRELEVVIEANQHTVYNYAGNGHSPHYYSNIYPNSIIGTIEAWEERYDPLTWTWAGSREGGEAETLRLLRKWYADYAGELL